MSNSIGLCAVLLDRDGVINEVVYREGRPASPRCLEEFFFCNGVQQALERLVQTGCRLFVVSNQPDVARSLLSPATLASMTERILAILPVEEVLICPHDDRDDCLCRKPKLGLLHRVEAKTGISLHDSFIVGDSWRDIAAGKLAGCCTILLNKSYNQDVVADYVVNSLDQTVDIIWGARHEQSEQPRLRPSIS